MAKDWKKFGYWKQELATHDLNSTLTVCSLGFSRAEKESAWELEFLLTGRPL